MPRFGTGLLVALTAIVTALVTSLFWIAAYNLGRGGVEGGESAAPGDVVTEETAGGGDTELVVGPSGLAIPVAGVAAAALTDTYSQARAGGARVHDAIDIMAPAGTPVVAAAEGTVEKLFFSQGGGGITAYIRSPDRQWSYYYAHLQAYAPGLHEGQHLARGAAIGRVGSTGNAAAAGPHLHFAVHRMGPNDRWHQGTPVNPYPLLASNRPAG